ncbi:sulfur carrier protein ThiS [Prochlorococcus sp. AH-716-O10]|nr:sulfur carrier protein ThiS [Prochlorococcus sp. AH-716-O10]
MKISVNGKEKKIELENEKASLSSALEFLGYKQNTVVVEVNDLIINSKKWDSEILKEGDKLEIVSIVGGG